MGITIKDIAKAAGVSHPTVSRALNDHPGISKKTSERIKKLAVEMGYIPNAAARGLKTNRTKALGVIISQIDDPFWSEVLNGVDSVLHPAGYSLFIAATHRIKEREKQVVQTMMQRGVDGVILLAPQFGADQSHILRAFGLPMAMVNNEGAAECEDLIFNDDDYGIRLILQHLIALGHKKIAYLGNKMGGLTNTNRQTGFVKALKAAGLEVRQEFIYQGSTGDPHGGREGASYFMSLTGKPTAIVCYSDYMALGVYNVMAEKKIRIPQDISITGFDNINIAAYLTPPLTTLHQYKFELGVGAAEMMLEMLEKKRLNKEIAQKQRKVSIKGTLYIRASTAPPGWIKDENPKN